MGLLRGDPGRSSFAIHALVAKHFLHGGYYPLGGSKAIATTLLQTVADAGGWTRIRADVASIEIEDGKAVGVVLDDGERIRARRIVSAVGVGATVRRLLPPHIREAAWAREVTALAPAPCHVCLYLGFKGDIRQAGASAANQWFYETWSTEEDGWDVHPDRAELGRAPILYCSFPSLKDPDHDPALACGTPAKSSRSLHWESFAAFRDAQWKKRGEAYDAFKERLKTALLAQFLEHVRRSGRSFATPSCRPLSPRTISVVRSGARFLRPRSDSGALRLPPPAAAIPGPEPLLQRQRGRDRRGHRRDDGRSPRCPVGRAARHGASPAGLRASRRQVTGPAPALAHAAIPT